MENGKKYIGASILEKNTKHKVEAESSGFLRD